ncbi:MAG: DUF429 domain-containing protein [Candidatus Aenigmarchaeota archaeon]|nr:DUF429 domain-containing protein [Candidatus Aenigmarchaeota archaeon]
MRAMGLDLAAKQTNPSGICIIAGEQTESRIYYYDKDILEEIGKINPDIIAIDAPLSFPSKGFFRHSDVLLQKMGYRPLSPNFKNMKQLVIRARKLAKRLQGKYTILEAFPQAAGRIFGLEKGRWESKDRFDAYLCALTAKYYLEGRYEAVGRQRIILPKSV